MADRRWERSRPFAGVREDVRRSIGSLLLGAGLLGAGITGVLGGCAGDAPATSQPCPATSSGGSGSAGAGESSSGSTTDGSSTSSSSGAPAQDGGTDGALPNVPKFKVKTPLIDILAYEERTTCYYFMLFNSEEFVVQKWQSQLTTDIMSMEVYFTKSLKEPNDTLTGSNCGVAEGGVNVPYGVYLATTPSASWSFPADDGTGKPIGKTVKAGQPGYLRLHVVNTKGVPVQVQAELEMTGYPLGTAITRAEPFLTYNGSITIDPYSSKSEIRTCDVPPGAKFFRMTTFSHSRSVQTFIRDGSDIVFYGTDWTNPGARAWSTSPFFEFASGKLTYQCDYVNGTSLTRHNGDSFAVDEKCAAYTYFFPATSPMMCFNEIGPYAH